MVAPIPFPRAASRLIERAPITSIGNESSETPSLLVIENEETFADVLRAALSDARLAVDVVRDEHGALSSLDRRRPTVMLLDLMPLGARGMSILRTLRARSETPILLLAASEAVEERIEALYAGADDCLSRPFKFEELTARLHALLRRHRVTVTDVLTVADLRLDRATREVTDRGRLVNLTPREFDLLAYFMLNRRQVLTREAILSRVWGYDDDAPTTNVVDVYVRYLRAKLGDGEHQRIESVRGVGYTLRG